MKDDKSNISGVGNRPDRDDRPSAKLPRTLTLTQMAFLDALSSKRHVLADMFRAALTALDTIAGHERFVLAAHEMREIMQLVFPIFDVPKRNTGIQDFDLLPLQKRWNEAKAQMQNGAWTGTVDGPLAAFLDEFDKQWSQRDQAFLTRKERVRTFWLRSDPPGIRADEESIAKICDEWKRLSNYFNGVAHHNKTTDDGEFNEQCSQCVELLLNRLRPRPYADYQELDALIGEVENA